MTVAAPALSIAERFWTADRGPGTARWIQEYATSRDRPHRGPIVRAVQQLVTQMGCESVLEVGCHCGPNLHGIAQACPTLTCVGVDINRVAVDAGKQAVGCRCGATLMPTTVCANRMHVYHAAFPTQTSHLATGCFDIVLTSYLLAYIGPRELPDALYELGRLARVAVVIAEPMVLSTPQADDTIERPGYVEWRHDYRAQLPWVQTLARRHAEIEPLPRAMGRLNGLLIAVRTDGGDA
jgi:hypothetical protein